MSEPSASNPEGAEAPDDYKVSDKAAKNVAEILAADSADESLRKYKESLLGTAAHGDLGNPDDPRKLIVTEFRVVFDPAENRPDIVFNLDTPEGLAQLQEKASY